MAINFCPNCGAKLKDGARFCSGCGQSIGVNVQPPVMNPNVVPRSGSSNGQNKSVLLLLGGVVVALLAVGAYVFLGSGDTGAKDPVTPAATATTADTNQPQPAKAVVPTDKRDLAKADLHKYGFDGDIVATSYGHDSKGYLAVEKTDQYGYRNIVVDKVNDRVATFQARMTFAEFANELQKKSGEPLIINFTIKNDTRDKDEKNGAWHGETHILPTYVLYEKSAAGVVVPGRICSAFGEHPSHYQGFLYEQKNVDMTNLVLTEAMALLANANEHNISV